MRLIGKLTLKVSPRWDDSTIFLFIVEPFELMTLCLLEKQSNIELHSHPDTPSLNIMFLYFSVIFQSLCTIIVLVHPIPQQILITFFFLWIIFYRFYTKGTECFLVYKWYPRANVFHRGNKVLVCGMAP